MMDLLMNKKTLELALDRFTRTVHSDVDSAIRGLLSTLFSGVRVTGPNQVPHPKDELMINEWTAVGILTLRLSTWNIGHLLSVKYYNGWYWPLSHSTESQVPELHDWDINDLVDYADRQGQVLKVDENEFKCFSESSDKTYNVDTKSVTCNCSNFKYRCSHHTIDREERLCKHLVQVYDNYPELKPKAMMQANEGMDSDGKDADGKKRYPRALFQMYVMDLKSVLNNFSNIIERYEFCGSYRRIADRVSDLDVLIQLKEGADWTPMLDYFESTMGYELIKQIGRGDHKAAYMIDGYVHVDFKCVEEFNWPFALMHFTGSKYHNINMRRRANEMGYTLNEYGLLNRTTNEYVQGLKTEEDVYKFLEVPYVEPYER